MEGDRPRPGVPRRRRSRPSRPSSKAVSVGPGLPQFLEETGGAQLGRPNRAGRLVPKPDCGRFPPGSIRAPDWPPHRPEAADFRASAQASGPGNERAAALRHSCQCCTDCSEGTHLDAFSVRSIHFGHRSAGHGVESAPHYSTLRHCPHPLELNALSVASIATIAEPSWTTSFAMMSSRPPPSPASRDQ